MFYVGIDLAWGERQRTGLAVLDADGRLVHSEIGPVESLHELESLVAEHLGVRL